MSFKNGFEKFHNQCLKTPEMTILQTFECMYGTKYLLDSAEIWHATIFQSKDDSFQLNLYFFKILRKISFLKSTILTFL